jgi:hypothetical protein
MTVFEYWDDCGLKVGFEAKGLGAEVTLMLKLYNTKKKTSNDHKLKINLKSSKHTVHTTHATALLCCVRCALCYSLLYAVPSVLFMHMQCAVLSVLCSRLCAVRSVAYLTCACDSQVQTISYKGIYSDLRANLQGLRRSLRISQKDGHCCAVTALVLTAFELQ